MGSSFLFADKPFRIELASLHRMHPLEKKIRRILLGHKLITTNGEKIVVALSGGPDSVCLLHVLARLRSSLNFTLAAAYVNHGLRPRREIEKETALVKNQVHRLNIDFELGKVDVKEFANNQKLSMEHAARLLRYAYLEKAAHKLQAQKIALAHTADDQAEEILMRLIKGTGRKGLSGMKIMRQGKYIRPFLTTPKSHLLAYLSDLKTAYIEDSSNQQRIFLRNKIRLDLIPYLAREFNPKIRRTLLQTANIFMDEEELLSDLTDMACEAVITKNETAIKKGSAETAPPDISLDITGFKNLARALQRRTLETACWQMHCRPQARQIEQLLHVINADGSRGVLHLTRGLRVTKSADRLIFSYPAGKIARRGDLVPDERKTFAALLDGLGKWQVEQIGLTVEIDCPDILPAKIKKTTDPVEYLNLDLITFPLTLRSPQPGDTFNPLGSKGTKKVSDFLIDLKVPAEQRWKVPLLLSKGRIVALLGLRIDHRFRITDDTTKVLRVRWQSTA